MRWRRTSVRHQGVRRRSTPSSSTPTTTAPMSSSTRRARFGQGLRLGTAEEAPDGPRVMLAGGLTPDNVAAAVAVVDRGASTCRRASSVAGPQGPAQGQAVHRNAKAAAPKPYRGPDECPTTGRTKTRTVTDEHGDGGAEPDRAASASSGDGSCPRRWCPRATSSKPRSARRGPTPHSAPSSTPSSATTPVARRPHECHQLGARARLRLLLKREDLNHTGSHKINNVLGQALLAKRMGKPRLVAETGAGQHGVATGNRRRAVRPGVRGLHGRRRRRAPGAERFPHAAARQRGRSGRSPAAAR